MALPDFRLFYKKLKKEELVDALDFVVTRSHYLMAFWVGALLRKHPDAKELLKDIMRERGRKMAEQLMAEVEPSIALKRDAITWWECYKRFIDPYVKSRIMGLKLLKLTPTMCRFRFTHCAFIKGWAYATITPEDMCEILKETERGLAEGINPDLELTEFHPGLARYEPYCQLTITLSKSKR